MLEEAAPACTFLIGKKLSATSTNSFNSLFEVEVEELDSDTEFTTEDEEEAHKLLETVRFARLQNPIEQNSSRG